MPGLSCGAERGPGRTAQHSLVGLCGQQRAHSSTFDLFLARAARGDWRVQVSRTSVELCV